MAEYHVYCRSDGIDAGILKTPNMWAEKSDVTQEACNAVAQYLYDNKKAIEFTIDGRRCRLEVRQDSPF